MAKQKFTLNGGEKIVFKTSRVKHGFWGAYTNTLTVTNQSVILEKYGMLNNFQGIERFNYCDIRQAIQADASNGEKQMELYVDNKVEEFSIQSGDDNELKILIMAINDQMSTDAELYDYNYYQSIITEAKYTDRILELKAKAQDSEPISSNSGLTLAGSVAKNILKSGDLSVKGVVKSVSKATAKQKKNGIFGSVMDGFLDDLGVRDIQDEFTEIGNDFREEFGLKTKITYAEKKELAELELNRKKQEMQQMKNAAIQERANPQRVSIEAPRNDTDRITTDHTKIERLSVKEQMDLLQQIKNLLDMGVLTQEEFEQKKNEILKG